MVKTIITHFIHSQTPHATMRSKFSLAFHGVSKISTCQIEKIKVKQIILQKVHYKMVQTATESFPWLAFELKFQQFFPTWKFMFTVTRVQISPLTKRICGHPMGMRYKRPPNPPVSPPSLLNKGQALNSKRAFWPDYEKW